MAARTYNLRDVHLLVNGVPITGFGETDAIMVERAEAAWVNTVGADGEVTRSKTNNRSGTITITTLHTTVVANALLTTGLLLDEETGDAIFPVIVTDTRTGLVMTFDECWIMQRPNQPLNKQVGELTWQLAFADVIEIRTTDDFVPDFEIPIP